MNILNYYEFKESVISNQLSKVEDLKRLKVYLLSSKNVLLYYKVISNWLNKRHFLKGTVIGNRGTCTKTAITTTNE